MQPFETKLRVWLQRGGAQDAQLQCYSLRKSRRWTSSDLFECEATEAQRRDDWATAAVPFIANHTHGIPKLSANAQRGK
jgi:hypothetical protein